MKKIILLSLALVAGLFVLTNVTNAQATPTLDLEITAVTGACYYGTSLDLGDHTQSYEAFNMTSTFDSTHMTGDRWTCNDTAGKAPRNMQISSTDLVAGAYSIANTAIEVLTPETATVYQGDLSVFTGSIGVFTSRSMNNLSAAHILFAKTSATGTVGELGVDNVALRVLVPANQEIGQYQSTITIVFPAM